MSASFQNLATLTIGTKRPAKVTSSTGLRGTPTTKLSSQKATPLYTVSPEIRQQLALNTPYVLLETFVEGNLDIIAGDVLTVGSSEYPIKSISIIPFRGDTRLRLIVEDQKQKA